MAGLEELVTSARKGPYHYQIVSNSTIKVNEIALTSKKSEGHAYFHMKSWVRLCHLLTL